MNKINVIEGIEWLRSPGWQCSLRCPHRHPREPGDFFRYSHVRDVSPSTPLPVLKSFLSDSPWIRPTGQSSCAWCHAVWRPNNFNFASVHTVTRCDIHPATGSGTGLCSGRRDRARTLQNRSTVRSTQDNTLATDQSPQLIQSVQVVHRSSILFCDLEQLND